MEVDGQESGWRLHRVTGRGPDWAEVTIEVAPNGGEDRAVASAPRTVRTSCFEGGLAAGLFAVTGDESADLSVETTSVSLLNLEAMEPGTAWQWRPPRISPAASRTDGRNSEFTTEVLGPARIETPAGEFDAVELEHVLSPAEDPLARSSGTGRAATGAQAEDRAGDNITFREHLALGIGPVAYGTDNGRYELASYLQPGPDGGEVRYEGQLPTTAFEGLRGAAEPETEERPDTSAADVVQLIGVIAKAPARELLDSGIFGRLVGPADGPGNVEFDIDARVRNDALVVAGTTDLPSGSWLMVVLRDSDAIDGQDYYGGTTHTVTEVQDGAVEMVFPIFDLASGRVEVLMVFDPAARAFDLTQPSVVEERYGPDGGRMTGRDVYDLFGHRALVVTTEVRNP